MNVVYNMDCMEGMKDYPDKYFDLAIVDPPYGINIGSAPGGGEQNLHTVRRIQVGGANPFGGRKNQKKATMKVGGGFFSTPKTYKAFDDSHIPDASYFAEVKRVSKNQIMWGGNYFLDNLGATPCMIVWDKRRRGLNFADCEIAWTSFKSPSRIFEFKWNGMLQEDMKEKEKRIHPTQKPVALYEWLLKNYAKEGDKILDTHVGSGSSRIACEKLGFDFVGYEIDEYYWQEQEKRFQTEKWNIPLF